MHYMFRMDLRKNSDFFVLQSIPWLAFTRDGVIWSFRCNVQGIYARIEYYTYVA